LARAVSPATQSYVSPATPAAPCFALIGVVHDTELRVAGDTSIAHAVSPATPSYVSYATHQIQRDRAETLAASGRSPGKSNSAAGRAACCPHLRFASNASETLCRRHAGHGRRSAHTSPGRGGSIVTVRASRGPSRPAHSGPAPVLPRPAGGLRSAGQHWSGAQPDEGMRTACPRSYVCTSASLSQAAGRPTPGGAARRASFSGPAGALRPAKSFKAQGFRAGGELFT
jgi:hypothetical protein